MKVMTYRAWTSAFESRNLFSQCDLLKAFERLAGGSAFAVGSWQTPCEAKDGPPPAPCQASMEMKCQLS